MGPKYAWKLPKMSGRHSGLRLGVAINFFKIHHTRQDGLSSCIYAEKDKLTRIHLEWSQAASSRVLKDPRVTPRCVEGHLGVRIMMVSSCVAGRRNSQHY
ncbi:Hypothetical protein NTJ_04424 [Nesidiocoris tenuis]|uniref:Uncharacterized protein n=1 Tax=Nesidiocoris tenuis TaxID=355587 RepID=A0ABN7AH77_9HEMI|nr:Hypothetical protein NTJ_04424 [Nesidiocoris tenuis]